MPKKLRDKKQLRRHVRRHPTVAIGTIPPPMRFVLLVGAWFEIQRLPDSKQTHLQYAGGLVSFSYTERFTTADKEVAERTANLMRTVLGDKFEISTSKNSLTACAKSISLQDAATFIVSEFMMWTPMASISLRELLCGNVVAHAESLKRLPPAAPYRGPAVPGPMSKEKRGAKRK